MTDWAAEGAELLEKEADYLCSRCNRKCERWRWPDKEDEWFSCPCCHCRIRTPEQIEATAKRRMADLGMTEEEYHEHCASFINTDPLPPRVLEGLRSRVDEMQREWTPACEHDKNPYEKGSA